MRKKIITKSFMAIALSVVMTVSVAGAVFAETMPQTEDSLSENTLTTENICLMISK